MTHVPEGNHDCYLSEVHRKIDDIFCAAHEKNIDLSGDFPSDSFGYRLQVTLDHIGANN